MKIITFLATFLITFSSCNCQKEAIKTNEFKSEITNNNSEIKTKNKMPILKYEAMSRNFSLNVKVENQILYFSNNRDFMDYEQKIEISNSDWELITALVEQVDLNKVKDLKWPTEKRYYDGAPHANIIFISDGIEYPANGFDHGFPPVEIENLVNKIINLTEKK